MSHVLIVEDERPIATLLSRILQAEGINNDIAINGLDALERISQKKPDLILLDLIMPIMTGEELIKELDKDPELAEIPIILVTTRSTVPGIEHKDYPLFEKPFNPSEVVAAVKNMLEKPASEA